MPAGGFTDALWALPAFGHARTCARLYRVTPGARTVALATAMISASCARPKAPSPPPPEHWLRASQPCPSVPPSASIEECQHDDPAACTAEPVTDSVPPQMRASCESGDACSCARMAEILAGSDEHLGRALELSERSCRAGARDGCDTLILLASLDCQDGVTSSCARLDALGEPRPDAPEEPPTPPPRPADATLCADVFELAMADRKAPRTYVESPSPACAAAILELTRRQGIRPWRSTPRKERAVRCPGRCGPNNAVRITVTHQGTDCFHTAVREGSGGGATRYCWEDGRLAMRDVVVW